VASKRSKSSWLANLARHALPVGLPLVLCAYAAGQSALPEPARIAKQYALTSAQSNEYYDPSDWELLASNDGEAWDLLDLQTNQHFTARSQRRVYNIHNRTAYKFYRLCLEHVSAVQLAEWELFGPAVGAREADLHTIVTAPSAPPLVGCPENAFDGDAFTRCILFDHGQSNCWIQVQYTRQSEILVTNLNQYVLLSRRRAAREPFLEQAPQILSVVKAQRSQHPRALSSYALTSANDAPERDPRDWRLLGSQDGGESWLTLDERQNETFATRYQRRVFALTKPAPCSIYRLEIKSVRVPGTNGANSVQLAGIEPLYVEKSETPLSLVVSAQGDNPPNESVEMAFDDRPETKWLDFADGRPAKSSWIQWQYLAVQSVPVINLNRLLAAKPPSPQPVALHFRGIVVSWNSPSNIVGLLDETGFDWFKLGAPLGDIRPGDRVSISGQLQLDGSLPLVLNPELLHLGTLPVVPELHPNQPLEEAQRFCLSSVEGRASATPEDSLHASFRFTSETGAPFLVHLLNPAHDHLPALAHNRLRVRGVVEPLLDTNGNAVAGAIWVANPTGVTLVPPTEKEWNEWPDLSVAEVLEPKPTSTPGKLVRVHGIVGKESAGKLLVLSEGTNHLVAHCDQVPFLSPGDPVEVAGFLDQQDGRPFLPSAQFRAPPASRVTSNLKPVGPLDDLHPVTDIRQIYDLAKTLPPTNFPVKIRGIVTFIDLGLNTFYLQNGPDSLSCDRQFAAGLAPFLRQEGCFVECEGQADTSYPLSVSAESVIVLGRGQWPKARRASWTDLIAGNYDTRWVEVEGVVSVVEKQRLSLLVAGGQMMVWINEMDRSAQNRLLGSQVRVRGVCAPLFNNRNQRLGIRLLVPSLEQIEIVTAAPENPFDLPLFRLGDVMQVSLDETNHTVHLVKTSGVVTHKERRRLFLQDGGDGLLVETREDTEVRPGDRVEVVGLPLPDGFSPKLVQASVRTQGHEKLPVAARLDLLEMEVMDQGARDATRGRTEATLLARSANESAEVLELRHDQSKKIFYAYLPLEGQATAPVPVGSHVRLEGVFKAKTDTIADFGQTITSFEMFLNSPADITILERPSWWTAQHTLWLLGGLGIILAIVVAWGASLRTRVRLQTRELREEIEERKRAESKLEEKTAALQKEIEERKRVELEMEKTHKELLDLSRQAGMAEVATNVLHNVGNVLNSVNISASLVSNQIKKSKISSVARVAALVGQHAQNLPEFLTSDPKGRQLPAFLIQLAEHLASEQTLLLNETASLKNNIEHINEIVAMQQNYARVAGVTEPVKIADLVEDALRMNSGALARHDVQLVREYDPQVPEVTVEKHKVLQILINLIRNAKYACDESGRRDKRLTVRVSNGDDRVRVAVIDNGVGIPSENLTKIFSHGFTTRKDGHGFGLHSGALAAKEMGGALWARSDGLNQGAAFTLELPLSSQPKAN